MMKLSETIYGITVGIVNSLLGAGGGMISVPAMKKIGLSQKKAQATTLAVILPLTIISAIIYLLNGEFSISDALRYIPFGFVGSLLGVRLMEKADSGILKKIFALFMLWAGIRMILR